MKVSPARRAAFEILLRVETERAYSSALLPILENELEPADRGLCHELVLGTLRRQIYLDRTIDIFSGGKKADIEVRIALRLALYQLYFLDRIPSYSAINESVNLVQAARKSSARGFVNAILRRATRERPGLSFIDDAERISVETSHPRWLVEKWVSDLGIERAESVARTNNESPTPSFRLLRELEEVSDKGREIVESSIPSRDVDGCFTAAAGSRLVELAERGEIYIQDEASQMVAHSVRVPDRGSFVDICAAPGGKAGLVARLNPTARLLVAADLHGRRLGFLRENCYRQGVTNIQFVQHDAESSLPFAETSFDAVLIDAPCSGTGTIRSNPEIRYRLKAEDLEALSSKQLSILTNASKLVRVGGSLHYSTCSLEPEENENVCRAFEDGNDNFERLVPDVPQRFITADGFCRTWPARDGMDGFFMARFSRMQG